MSKSVDQLSTKNQETFLPDSEFPFLPAKQSDNANKERVFRTSITAGEFSKLEIEASERGITPFRLAGLVVSAYIQGKLKPLD